MHTCTGVCTCIRNNTSTTAVKAFKSTDVKMSRLTILIVIQECTHSGQMATKTTFCKYKCLCFVQALF